MAKVAIAGASGFVGSALIDLLAKDHQIVALSRQKQSSEKAGVEWRQCDFMSLLQTEEALQGADVAVYLVHSMAPTAALTQANFEDLDLLAADNFFRAAKKKNIKHLIYLGGLIPDHKKLSRHLKSRLEVETCFRQSNLAYTILRAGLIIGSGGSSFNILKKLVMRLPIMILPSWTKTETQATALTDVIHLIKFCILNEKTFSSVFDLGSDEVVTYRSLIKQTAIAMNKKPLLIPFPAVSPEISKLWVSLITNTSYSLVSPLVESLKSPMLCRDRKIYTLSGLKATSLKFALTNSMSIGKKSKRKRRRSYQSERTVRSVQRMILPASKTAKDVADDYAKWVSGIFFGVIRASIEPENKLIFRFSMFSFQFYLLVLERDVSRTSVDRQLFRVKGGALSKKKNKGRLEFREVLDRQYILAAIHDFSPSLPWFIYFWTQAKVHLWVMKGFAIFLKNQNLSLRGKPQT